jgi:hypothetical protein
MKISAVFNKTSPTDRLLAVAESVPAGEVLTAREVAVKMGLSLDRFKRISTDPALEKNRYKASLGVPAYWGSRKTIAVLNKRMK